MISPNKRSIIRTSVAIRHVEAVDGDKIIGRISTTDGRTLTVIKGDRIILVRRKKVMVPK